MPDPYLFAHAVAASTSSRSALLTFRILCRASFDDCVNLDEFCLNVEASPHCFDIQANFKQVRSKVKQNIEQPVETGLLKVDSGLLRGAWHLQ